MDAPSPSSRTDTSREADHPRSRTRSGLWDQHDHEGPRSRRVSGGKSSASSVVRGHGKIGFLTRAILGLIPKRAGKIEVFDRDIDSLDDMERRAMERRWGRPVPSRAHCSPRSR